MILYYTSSNGQTFNLKVGKVRTRTADFHTYTWDPQSVGQRYGERVYRFDKPAITYTMLLDISGTTAERRMWLNLLHAAFEHDIRNMTPGKITHGASSIDCYITYSSTYEETPYTSNEINVYCPYPFWTEEKLYTLVPISEQEDVTEYPYLDYPYDYSYDFKADLDGYMTIENTAQADAEYRLIIHGAATAPFININGVKIGVIASIGASEYVVIDSRLKTVTKYSGNIEENLFNSRYKGDVSMFTPIPSGVYSVLWSGLFGCELYLYEERSEPIWS